MTTEAQDNQLPKRTEGNDDARAAGLETAELTATINDANIDQTFALDTKLRVVSWNTACEQITGISRGQALGRHLAEVRPAMAAAPAMAEAIKQALQGFKSFVPWEEMASGSSHYEHHVMPLAAADRLHGILIILHDVAHRIKAELELKRLNRALTLRNKQLKHRTDELAQFNWVASHDLKEPLRKIYTFIEMVATKEGQKLSDAARSNLRRAQGAVQRMGLLTDDIVNFSQAAAPDETPEKVAMPLLVESAMARYAKMIVDTGAIIKLPELPAILGYPKMLQQLVDNLLSNSLKFHKAGAQPVVEIEYRNESGSTIALPEADAEIRYHCLSFTDNGIGLAPEYTERIFGMFQRLDSEGIYPGTGMGLPISRKIAEAHEGFIAVRTEEGNGSTFTCYLKDYTTVSGG